jgi:hypothetical protein
VIETTSGVALLWRLHHSNDVEHRRESSERIALRRLFCVAVHLRPR